SGVLSVPAHAPLHRTHARHRDPRRTDRVGDAQSDPRLQRRVPLVVRRRGRRDVWTREIVDRVAWRVMAGWFDLRVLPISRLDGFTPAGPVVRMACRHAVGASPVLSYAIARVDRAGWGRLSPAGAVERIFSLLFSASRHRHRRRRDAANATAASHLA